MNLAYFFRIIEDNHPSQVPLVVVLLFIVICYLLARVDYLVKLYALFALFLQCMILFWYQGSGRLLADGLPLYHCRLIIWILGVGLLLGQHNKFMSWISLMGLPFSVGALLIRDMDPYLFPHVTFVYYFLGHGMILILSLIYLRNDYCSPSYKEISAYTLLLHTFIQGINIFLQTDYAYLRQLPFISEATFTHSSFLIVSLVVLTVSWIMKFLQDRIHLRQTSTEALLS
ncbi:TMEM164 family acyltransferase [Facklamia hominis]